MTIFSLDLAMIVHVCAIASVEFHPMERQSLACVRSSVRMQVMLKPCVVGVPEILLRLACNGIMAHLYPEFL